MQTLEFLIMPRVAVHKPLSWRDDARRLQLWWVGGAVALMTLTAVVYLPVIRTGGFIWDDDHHLAVNPNISTERALRGIWLDVGSTQQYYPLVFTTLWFEHRLFGDWAGGYHAVNVALHAISCVLLWRLLARLRLRGAWLAAAVFAIHPVHVESVAWISELKNVLSGLLVLCAAHLMLPLLQPELYPDLTRRRVRANTPWIYIAGFLLFCLALTSKTVVCTLPAALLLLVYWKRGRIGAADVLRVTPMLLVGAGFGLLTAYLERGQIGATGKPFELSPPDRILISGRAVWFYAAKLLWPWRLVFIYPRWHIDLHLGWQWCFPIAAVLLLASLFALRRMIGRGPLVAVLYFGGTLAPALGFVNVFPMRYSFVADHFQYLASIGVIALIITALAQLRAATAINGAGSIALLALLSLLSWRQQPMYRDQLALWSRTIELNPRAGIAYNNLGNRALLLRDYDRAQQLLERAVELEPDEPIAHFNLGQFYSAVNRPVMAIDSFRHAVQLGPRYAEAHYRLAVELRKVGEYDDAIAHLRDAIQLQPISPLPYNELATLLAERGRVEDAERTLRLAIRSADSAQTHFNLAIVLGRKGQQDEALAELQRALEIDPEYQPARAALERARAGSAPPQGVP